MSESENETETMEEFYERMGGKKEFQYRFPAFIRREAHTRRMEERIIALERGLEGVLRRLEESGQAEDEAGWFGRPE